MVRTTQPFTALCVLALFCLHEAAYSQRLPPAEEHYRELWSEPVMPMTKRPKIGRWRRPVFSELHRAVTTTPPIPADALKERAVKDTFRRLGVFRQKFQHFRMTCRRDLCEYVIVYSRDLKNEQVDQAENALNSVTAPLCPPSSCQVGLVIGGNQYVGGFGVLGYLIPTNGKFI